MKSGNLLWLMALVVIMVFAAGNAYSGIYGEVELPQTGQTTSYSAGDDGDLQIGAAWPSPRFTNPDGSTPITGDVVVDQLTGLMWLQDPTAGGSGTWKETMDTIFNSTAGGYTDWRMPNLNELETLINYEVSDTAAWLNSQGFASVQSAYYYASTTYQGYAFAAWMISLEDGTTGFYHGGGNGSGRNFIKSGAFSPPDPYGWPVRDSGGAGAVDLPVTGDTGCVYEKSSTFNDWGFINCTSGVTTWAPVAIQDGALQKGVAWPAGGNSPDGRFDNNFNGTITDLLTGLQWTRSGSVYCDTDGGNGHIYNFQEALDYIAKMNAGTKENFGYTDWRLPNKKEMYSLMVHIEVVNNEWYQEGQGFENVHNSKCSPASLISLKPGYWTSTTYPADTDRAYSVQISQGLSLDYSKTNPGKTLPDWYTGPVPYYIWPVRDPENYPWIIGVEIEPAGGGSVAGTGFNCPPDCTESYMGASGNIDLTPTPSEISTFDYWTGCDSEIGNVCTVSVDTMSKGVRATFKVPDIRIVPNAVSFGSVDVGSYAERTITFTSYENKNYQALDTVDPSLPFSIVPGSNTCAIPTNKNFIAPIAHSGLGLIVGVGTISSYPGPYYALPLGDSHNPATDVAHAVPLIPGTVTLKWTTTRIVPRPSGTGTWNLRSTAMDSCECGYFYSPFIGDGYGVYGEIDYATGAISNLIFEDPIKDTSGWRVAVQLTTYSYSTLLAGILRDFCEMTVKFAPTEPGTFSDTFKITGLKPIALRGTGASGGAGGPDISVSSNALSFLNTALNINNDQTLTVTNDGGAVLNIGTIAVTGNTQLSLIAGQDNCSGQAVTATGGTCTVGVRYTAAATAGGPHIASLGIPSDDPDENPVYVSLTGSSITSVSGDNSPPTRPELVSPLNGTEVSTLTPLLIYEPGEDGDVCISEDNPLGCDDTQELHHTLYLATDPAFQNLLSSVADLDNSNVSYAMVVGNPVFVIALFGLVAFGVFLRRKKIALIIIAVMFTGLLLVSCANHQSGDPGGGSEAVQVQAGKTYYWKVIADDGQGGVAESDTWSFTTAP